MSDALRTMNTLKPGEVRVIDGKMWGRCQGCKEILRVDGLFRGWHFCAGGR